MIIDATDLIMGRLAAFAAKQALLGEKIEIVNCEKAVITGRRKFIFAKYRHKRERGTPRKGPFILRRPSAIVKRTIRGMLPYKQGKGKIAFKNIMCYEGLPEVYAGKKLETVETANVDKVVNIGYITVADLSNFLGVKQ